MITVLGADICLLTRTYYAPPKRDIYYSPPRKGINDASRMNLSEPKTECNELLLGTA